MYFCFHKTTTNLLAKDAFSWKKTAYSTAFQQKIKYISASFAPNSTLCIKVSFISVARTQFSKSPLSLSLFTPTFLLSAEKSLISKVKKLSYRGRKGYKVAVTLLTNKTPKVTTTQVAVVYFSNSRLGFYCFLRLSQSQDYKDTQAENPFIN